MPEQSSPAQLLAALDQQRAELRDWYARLAAPEQAALFAALQRACVSPGCWRAVQNMPPPVLACVRVLALTQLLALAAGEG